MQYSMQEIATLLRENSPIALCDGSPISKLSTFENYFSYFLYSRDLEFTCEDRLYTRNKFDLSGYKSIVFDSHGGIGHAKNSFEYIVNSFPKDNLRVVIVGSYSAYLMVKDLVYQLDIMLIGCRIEIPVGAMERLRNKFQTFPENNIAVPGIEEIWAMDYPNLFFDPSKAEWYDY